jgi:menaquinone-dependent protoporphyrinogen IX oxidase
MKVEILHASKFGNGATVAEELGKDMAAKGATVNVHHVKEVKAKELPAADLYVFGSPGRIGKPIGKMRRFLKKAALPSGAKVALFATEPISKPDKKTGKVKTPEEVEKWNHILSIMTELIQEKGAVKVAETKFYVVDMKGPLEDGWQKKVEDFASLLIVK